jgi:formylglycine-generating enzyme
MNMESVLLGAVRDDPGDRAPWLVLADWLEENGQLPRAELLRLCLAPPLDDPWREERIGALLAAGVQPGIPVTVNSIGMKLALIPPGSFWMGSLPEEANRYTDEDPRHRVDLTQSFLLGVYQVTQGEYERVMRTNPSHFSRANGGSRATRTTTSRFPVENVSWYDAEKFCAKLSELPEEHRAGRVYRLPTEAEWEYACRAGMLLAPFHVGPTLSATQANFDGNYPCGGERGAYLEHPTPVGSYPPNAFGLHDMHGNVWEWCSDWFDSEYYAQGPRTDPPGPPNGRVRVQRGGSWYSYGWACRSGQRSRAEPSDRNYRSGMRVCATLKVR